MANSVKSVVLIRETEWREFKALAARRGQSVQARLGELVARDVRNDRRREIKRLGRSKAAERVMRESLAEIRAAGQPTG